MRSVGYSTAVTPTLPLPAGFLCSPSLRATLPLADLSLPPPLLPPLLLSAPPRFPLSLLLSPRFQPSLPQPLPLPAVQLRQRVPLPSSQRSRHLHRQRLLPCRSHRSGSRPGRSCPPSFRRFPESPSTVPESSTQAFPQN